MKKFNLRNAKTGKPVCTKYGSQARIICFDCEGTDYPIIALVKNEENEEEIISFNEQGTCEESDDDLMMAPEKKHGWINIYRNEHEYYNHHSIFKNKENAIANGFSNEDTNYFRTIKIEWEE